MPPAARRHPDLVIAHLAEMQHEIVHRAQLLEAGISDEVIRHRRAVRWLRQRYRGVYKVGPGRPSELGLFIAAVFAAGEGAFLSWRSAGALWNMRPQTTGPIEVTVSRRGVRAQRGLRVHTTRTLPPEETTVHNRIPCTTPARTLVDMAAVLPPHGLKRAVERAQIERIFDLTAVEAALAGARGRRGTKQLRWLLGELNHEPPPTRSEFERRFLDLIETASLRTPVVNGWVCGYEVDFHGPDQKLIVETDGRETHDTQIAFQRDRERDLDLELAGWHVIRITWKQLTREPEKVLALLGARL